MHKIKSFLKKRFSTKNLLISLLGAFLVLLILMVLFAVLIYFDKKPIFSFTSEGISTFFEIYRFPIAIAAALLAIATLAVTTLRSIIGDQQIMEMKAQREASYQPDIVIEQRQFRIQTGTGEPIIDPHTNRITGKSDRIYLKINLDETSEKEPNIFLHNIGRGVAKNFKFRLSYDVKACLELMDKFNVNNYFVLDIRNNNVEIYTKGTPQARFWGMFPNDDWNTKIDFILPISGSPSPTKILMPYLYTILNFFKDELHLHSKKEFHDPNNILNLFPKLIFECEYLDIGLKPHRKKFEIKTQFLVFHQLLDVNNRFNDITYEYDVVPTEINK